MHISIKYKITHIHTQTHKIVVIIDRLKMAGGGWSIGNDYLLRVVGSKPRF